MEKFKDMNGLQDMEAIMKQEEGLCAGTIYHSMGNPIPFFAFTATHIKDDMLSKGNRFRLKARELPKRCENGILCHMAEPSSSSMQ